MWSYKLTDSIPLSIEFPIDKSRFKLPMAILTRPSSGTGQDPGLIIIDGISGLVKFYESVQHAPSLGLINDKSLELNLPLKKNECIVVAENIEPSGIVIATNFNRCLLISLRDFKSKPQLGYLELLNNQKFYKNYLTILHLMVKHLIMTLLLLDQGKYQIMELVKKLSFWILLVVSIYILITYSQLMDLLILTKEIFQTIY